MATTIGKKQLAPGETVGLMSLAGVTPGSYYTLNIRGARLGIVSGDGSVPYEIDPSVPIVTNSEVTVKNLASYYDIIVVLASPSPTPSGGGGSGEVPTLDDVLAASPSGTNADMIFMDDSGTVVGINGAGVNSMNPGNTLASFSVGGIGVQSLTNGDSTQVAISGLSQSRGGASRSLTVEDAATGTVTVTYPNESGQLALKTDIVVPAPPGAGTYTLRSVDGTVSWVSA